MCLSCKSFDQSLILTLILHCPPSKCLPLKCLWITRFPLTKLWNTAIHESWVNLRKLPFSQERGRRESDPIFAWNRILLLLLHNDRDLWAYSHSTQLPLFSRMGLLHKHALITWGSWPHERTACACVWTRPEMSPRRRFDISARTSTSNTMSDT